MVQDNIYLVTEKLELASHADVDALRDWLGVELPSGYRNYVTSLGSGTYCGLVHVFLPGVVQAKVEGERELLRDHFESFWGSNGSLQLQEAVQSVPFAMTIDGDLVFYSLERRQLFVLPRHDDQVYWMPRGFDDPTPPDMSLMSLENWDGFRYFDSHCDREVIELFTAEKFERDELIDRIEGHCQLTHGIDDGCVLLLFIRDIQGLIYLQQAPDDPRIGMRLEFDLALHSRIAPLLAELLAIGYHARPTRRSIDQDR